MEQQKRNPADFLKQIKGRQVIVKLNDGTVYKGTYICLDGNLNTVLEKCEELKDGKVINKFGDIFIRGNNVCYIAPYTDPSTQSQNQINNITSTDNAATVQVTAE